MLLNELLKIDEEKSKKVKIRFCMKNDELKYAIDDYKLDTNKVNEDWLLWKRTRRMYRVGEIAICLVRIYDTNEWLLTTIKEITEELDARNSKGYIGKELEQYKKYFGKVVLKFDKDFQQGCVRYSTVARRMKVIDTEYSL